MVSVTAPSVYGLESISAAQISARQYAQAAPARAACNGLARRR
jgi:hypothetical protein